METFTLVRHSGYAVAGNPDLEDAVEVAEITSQQAYMVRAVGGRIFTSRADAYAAEAAINDPAVPHLPRHRGHFASQRIAGAEIHVPAAGR